MRFICELCSRFGNILTLLLLGTLLSLHDWMALHFGCAFLVKHSKCKEMHLPVLLSYPIPLYKVHSLNRKSFWLHVKYDIFVCIKISWLVIIYSKRLRYNKVETFCTWTNECIIWMCHICSYFAFSSPFSRTLVRPASHG